MMALFIFLLVMVCVISKCCFGYQQCESNPYMINPGAQARFAVVASIRQSTKTEECYKVSQNALQYLAAIEWAVNKINAADFLKVLKLGFDVYDDCGLDRLSTYSVLNAVSENFPEKIRKCSINSSLPLQLGILGTSRSQTTSSILMMLNGTNIPVISPYASLPELRSYDNFMRTTPADTEEVKTIVQLMVELEWTYVAAIHTSDNYGENGIKEIQALAASKRICVDVVQSYDPTEDFSSDTVRESLYNILQNQQSLTKDDNLGVIYFGNKEVIKSLLKRIRLDKMKFTKLQKLIWIMSDFVGTSSDVFKEAGVSQQGYMYLTISPSSVLIKEAKSYFEEKWKNRAIDTKNDPLKRLMNEVSDPLEEYRTDYIRPVVDAVYAFGSALNDAFKAMCQNYLTMCIGFEDYVRREYLKHMKAVNFSYTDLEISNGPEELIRQGRQVTFTASGDYVPDQNAPLYDINVYQTTKHTFIKVGEFINGELNLNRSVLPSFRKSVCSKVCDNCTSKPTIPYQFQHGGDNSEAIIIGIFPLHDLSENDKYGCGNLQTGAYYVIVAEAFFFAVKQLSARTNMNFSALAFDDCYSKNRLSMIVSEFMSGKLKISDGKGNFLNPENIVAVIGPAASGVTVPITFQFMSLRIPVVSYASSTPDLDDKINFPYFLRTVPSDVDQARAMMEIVKEMNWKYIGVLFVNNNYGSKGKEQLLKYANESKICVGRTIEVSEYIEGDMYGIIDDMKRTKADVFLYFGTDVILKKLLKNMQSESYRNVTFLASEDWGERKDILDEAGDVAKGSITSKFETVSIAKGLKEYLKSRAPVEREDNSWFRDFWGDFFNCNPPGGFDRQHQVDCDEAVGFSEDHLNVFLSNQRVVHVLKAVYAVGQGLNIARQTLCGNEKFPCANIKEPIHMKTVISAIQDAELELDGGKTFRVFNEKGNGNIGFKILNVHKTGSNSYEYVEIGEYKSEQLILNKQSIRFYEANGEPKSISAPCTDGKCAVCQFFTSPTSTQSPFISHPISNSDEFRMADIILIAVLGSFLVLFLITICLITTYFRRRMKDLRRRVLENKTKIMYVNEDISRFPTSSINLNGIKFQNERSNETMPQANIAGGSNVVTRRPSEPESKRGIINEAFLPENYLQLTEEMPGNNTNNTPNLNHLTDYSPLTPNGERMNPDLINLSVNAKEDFRPTLPPRDHPFSKKYNSNSSLDSGTTTPTFPKMGTRPTIVNGQVPSGSPSPTRPKPSLILPDIESITQSQGSPVKLRKKPADAPLVHESPVANNKTHNSPRSPQMYISQNPHSANVSNSPEDISEEFPPPPDFTAFLPHQSHQNSKQQHRKLRGGSSSSRSPDGTEKISRV